MNRRGVRSGAALALSLAAGLGIGWSLRSGAAPRATESANPDTMNAVSPARASRPQTTSLAAAPPRNLAAVEKLLVPKGGLPPEARAAVAAMNLPKLRELMLQVAKEKSRTDGSLGLAWQDGLLNAAAEEMCRRDLRGSLEWAKSYDFKRDLSSIKSWEASGLAQLLPRVIEAAGKQDAAAAMAWQAEFVPESWDGDTLGGVAYRAAVARGAEAVLEMERQPSGMVPLDEGFPEGFDFPRLIAGTQRPETTYAAASYWAAKDPEAAYDGVKEKLPDHPDLWGVLMSGVATTRGDQAAAAWVSEKLGDLPAEQRLRAIGQLRVSTASEVEAVMGALKDEEDRSTFVQTLLNQGGRRADPNRPDVRALQLLGGEDEQVQALSDFVRGGGELRRLEYTMKLSPEAWQQVKAAGGGGTGE